jgi:hypothetical protein
MVLMLYMLVINMACKESVSDSPISSRVESVQMIKDNALKVARDFSRQPERVQVLSRMQNKRESSSSQETQSIVVGSHFNFEGHEYEFRLSPHYLTQPSSGSVLKESSNLVQESDGTFGVMLSPDVFHPNDGANGEPTQGSFTMDIYKSDSTIDQITLSYDDIKYADSLLDAKGYPIYFVTL